MSLSSFTLVVQYIHLSVRIRSSVCLSKMIERYPHRLSSGHARAMIDVCLDVCIIGRETEERRSDDR